MKVFLSWSGDLSREVASLLHKKMRHLLWGRVDVFMSKHDITSGTKWAQALADELKKSMFAIVCLTPDNLQSPWLLYEAGALTSQGRQRLCALLLGGLQQQDVPSPLTLYQNRSFTQAELQALMEDIRKTVEQPPTESEFAENFSTHWPDIWNEYQQILKKYPPRPHSRKTITTFERTVLRLPLAETVLSELGDFVEQVREKCLNEIRKLSNQPGISTDCVRANVFVPEYTGSRRGWAFELAMHARLRRQMNRPQEWGIRLGPGQGAAGTVFIECHQRIVNRRDFELTDELLEIIHPELKWIISSPIKDKSGVALAVLNVDGLKYDPDQQTVLEPVAELIRNELTRLQASFDGCPKATVSVCYSELQ